jgi:hypothetical protein
MGDVVALQSKVAARASPPNDLSPFFAVTDGIGVRQPCGRTNKLAKSIFFRIE